MGGIDGNKEHPEHKADNPSVPCSPVLKNKLSSSQIRRDRYRVVEPVVPREGKTVCRREEPCGIGVEGAWNGAVVNMTLVEINAGRRETDTCFSRDAPQ